MMPDRNQAPTYQPITGFDLITPRHIVLSNGLNVFIFDSGEQEVVRAEWIFDHAFVHTENPLLPTCACEMLLEGTTSYTSRQIADTVDFYGAFLIPQYDADRSTLSLFSLAKHLDKLLPLVKEVLVDSIFPDRELATYIRNSKQKLQVSLEKNSFVARRLFNAALFGDTRYGKCPEIADYESITRQDLISLFKSQYTVANCTLVLSGHITEAILGRVAKHFGDEWLAGEQALFDNVPAFPNIAEGGGVILEERADALQSAIRLGNRSISRSHPEFPGLQVVNTLLGGYFGSRLMANIREDKGYTYSIGSGLGSLKHGSFFTIASEVGTAVTSATLNEVEKEIGRLKEEPVTDEELTLVKNYMMGSMLGSLENVFSHADKFKNVYFSGLELDYYRYYTDVVRNIDTKEIQRLANAYLDFDSMVKVIVGKM